MQRAERDASPQRFGREEVEETEPIERIATASSSSSSAHSARRPQTNRLASMATVKDETYGMERHPTALSRIETGRSQHSATVGGGLGRRSTTRRSKALPNFGAGKPFPPDLPEREQYVVEFDGPDDPLHAMNWPMSKKCGIYPWHESRNC